MVTVSDNQVFVRPVRDEDLVAVAAIHRYYIEDTIICVPETERTATQWQELVESLRARHLPFLVAEQEGTVGYAYVHPWKPGPSYRHTGEVTIYLAPEHTDQRVGEALMNPLIVASEEAGITQLLGSVVQTTAAPRTGAFGRRYGFEECGTLHKVGQKHGQWLDLLLYQRHLTQPSASDS